MSVLLKIMFQLQRYILDINLRCKSCNAIFTEMGTKNIAHK